MQTPNVLRGYLSAVYMLCVLQICWQVFFWFMMPPNAASAIVPKLKAAPQVDWYLVLGAELYALQRKEAMVALAICAITVVVCAVGLRLDRKERAGPVQG